ncbi:uncharacterized protein LOC131023235 [Salvia miltiorrhiza]|uniref:uncharacterized protein LOC131023235 n=1 Tax=Salvia miltiorrhiza TaxID=226208 RepID=UPI0025AB6B9C|nr:uncharacterized protein LOC131023235 [Salvia miltiorrhiza]
MISDNILVGYECMHWLRNQKKGNVGFDAAKLDMRKAYDRVEWTFLRAMLTRLGFPTRMVEIIMDCVMSMNFSFVYGSLTPSRGLRQGRPLSPFLFVICAQALAPLGVILRWLLIRETSGHSLYLGLSTFTVCQKRVQFDFLRERVYKKFSSWKNKFSSAGGKEILIKSVILAIPTYTMSCFKVRMAICVDIEHACSNFWWGESDSGKHMHWASWEKFCMQKSKGGSGIATCSDGESNDTLVKDFMVGGAWDKAKLVAAFLPFEAQAIESISLSRLGAADDWFWVHDEKGRFSVKSGYLFAIGYYSLNLDTTSEEQKHWWSRVWLANIPPKVKPLDVDFSFHDVSGAAGVGFLVRDWTGAINAAAAHRMGRTETILIGELQAMMLGTGFCLENNIGLIVLYSDSMLVVHVVHEDYKGMDSLCDDLFEAFVLAKDRIVFYFRHVRREVNRATDSLANFAAWSDGVMIWKQGFPAWLTDIVH